MAFVTLYSQDDVFDNTAGTETLNWSIEIPDRILIPSGEWFSTGQIQLQRTTSIVVTTTELSQQTATIRFVNPRQSQFGHYAEKIGTFVKRDGRLMYENQLLAEASPQVQISNTRADEVQRYELTTNSSPWTAQQFRPITVCGTSRGVVTTNGGESALDFSGSIGAGDMTMTILPGRMQLAPTEGYVDGTPVFTLFLSELDMCNALSGVLWAGLSLSVRTTIGYSVATSGLVGLNANNFIQITTPPYAVAHSCEFGQSVVVPGTSACAPGELVRVVQDPTGLSYLYECGSGSD